MGKIFILSLLLLSCMQHKHRAVHSDTNYFSLDRTQRIEIKADSSFGYYTVGHQPVTLCYGKVISKNNSLTMRNAQLKTVATPTVDSSGRIEIRTLTQCDSIEPIIIKNDTLIFRSKKFVKYKR